MSEEQKKIRYANIGLLVCVVFMFVYQVLGVSSYDAALNESITHYELSQVFWRYALPIIVFVFPVAFLSFVIFKNAKILAEKSKRRLRDLTFKEWHGF